MSGQADTETEFSYRIDLNALPRAGKSFSLSAPEHIRAKVANRLGAPSVEKLEGDAALSATRTKISLSGVLRASLTRECVASLEPMAENIEEEFDVTFLRQPDTQPTDGPANDESWDSEEDAPEIHYGDHFDLGEFLVQQVSLAMDPFPRKPGAESLVETYGSVGNVSPFAALREKIQKSDENQ